MASREFTESLLASAAFRFAAGAKFGDAVPALRGALAAWREACPHDAGGVAFDLYSVATVAIEAPRPQWAQAKEQVDVALRAYFAVKKQQWKEAQEAEAKAAAEPIGETPIAGEAPIEATRPVRRENMSAGGQAPDYDRRKDIFE